MKISDIYTRKTPLVSFEIFPPKPDMPLDTLLKTVSELKNLEPDFISVTYGAGGGNRSRTIEISSEIQNSIGLEVLTHLTSVAAVEDEIDTIIRSLENKNIENILALRGDLPSDIPDFNFNNQSFKYASDLVAYIRQRYDRFCIGAACYPEVHLESPGKEEDMQNLKRKVDCGVDFLITQLFFDNSIFYSFLEDVRNIGIHCPISAGIMPVFNTKLIKKITQTCGASIPQKLAKILNRYENSPDDILKAGVDYAENQIADLLDHNVDGIHLCTMNRSDQTRKIINSLGI